MHARNRHQDRYDLSRLSAGTPELLDHVFINEHGGESIDFADPQAVKTLNKAILKEFYGVAVWDIPEDFLCPPIPGRADYLHHAADLIKARGSGVRVLDIGTGASCVYPLIGRHEYGWKFVGSDVNGEALKNAKMIIRDNHLESGIEVRLQSSPPSIFRGVILPLDVFDFTMCNPPFHSSAAEARMASNRKLKKLNLPQDKLNFGGRQHELWCPGGEASFIGRMMEESVEFKGQCRWFSSLVSKEENLKGLKAHLKKLGPTSVQVKEMAQGQKKSRFIAWSWQKAR